MKLLQINLTQNVGSTGKIAEQIGQLVLNQGGESYMAWGRLQAKTTSVSIPINNKFDTICHIAYHHILDMDGLGSKRATQDLVSKIEAISPDIIHLHVIHGACVNYEVLFSYLSTLDIPVVWTMHDCWAFTGHCSHFESLKCEKWKDECHACPCKKQIKKLELINRAKSNFNKKKTLFTSVSNMTIVPVSNWLEGLIKQSFLSKYNVKVIHNGIDIDVFRPRTSEVRDRFGIKNNFTVIGVANFWGPRKGYQDFIKLAKKNPHWSFIMVGLSNKQIKEIPNNVIGIPFTNGQRELADLYSAADVFVNTTYEDTYPTVNLEAIACGTPVITYRTGGSPESVISGKTGYVVKQGDLDALELMLIQVESLGKQAYTVNCRTYAEKNFKKEDRFADYIELYRQLSDK